ncbi:MAG: bifunctional precorrin-2 dehydrogenase/sirohydrochlorin ferrochelatase [Planctomycetota bacterium]
MTQSASAPLYPIFLDIRSMPVLVVGGGAVAARKVADLVESGARVVVVSPAFDPGILELEANVGAHGGTLKLSKRLYRPGDLKGRKLVFAATDNVALNQSICKAAHALGSLANCAAPPEAGSFALPGMVRRGAFCLAVSTGGASAALSAHWRKRLDAIAGPEWGELVALLEKKRLEVKARVSDPALRRTVLSSLGRAHWAVKVKKLGVADVERRMDDVIDKTVARAGK